MRILYINQFYKTFEEGGIIRSYYLSNALSEAGHDVHIVCGSREKQYSYKEINGVKIHYLPVQYDSKFGFYRRIFSFLRFVLSSIRFISKLPKFDKVFATSTPLTVGLIALWYKKKHKVPYIFEIRDLWPSIPVELGIIRWQWLANKLFALEKAIYLHSEKIIALAPGYIDYIKKIVPDKEIVLLPNFSDTTFWQTIEDDDSIPIQSKKDEFVITYTGSLGYANHIAYFLDLALYAHNHNLHQYRFYVAGFGPDEEVVKAYPHKNLHFFGFLTKKQTRSLLQKSNVCYVSFLNHPSLTNCSPNKFFDALAVGKPVIVNFEGWIKELVTEKKCGFYVNPEQPKAFFDVVNILAENPTLQEGYSLNANRLATEQFELEKIKNKFMSLFE